MPNQKRTYSIGAPPPDWRDPWLQVDLTIRFSSGREIASSHTTRDLTGLVNATIDEYVEHKITSVSANIKRVWIAE